MVEYSMIQEKVKRYADGLKGLSRLRRNLKIENDIDILKSKYKQTETLDLLINEMKKLIIPKSDGKIKK